MPLCVAVIEPNRWGGGKRLPKCLECLARYGSHAKEVLPRLKDMRRNLGLLSGNATLIDKAIAEIESSTASPTLVDLKSFMARPYSVREKAKR
jgi:hypothetical protein